MRGSFCGLLSQVSKVGDWGFCAEWDIRGATGQALPTDLRRVFVHVKDVPDIGTLSNGMWMRFDLKESERKKGQWQACNITVLPHLIGTITSIPRAKNYGFIGLNTIALHPRSAVIRDLEMPAHDVLVHTDQMSQGFAIGLWMRLAFCATPSPRHPARHEAMNARVAPMKDLEAGKECMAPYNLYRVTITDSTDPNAPTYTHRGDFARLEDAMTLCKKPTPTTFCAVYDDSGAMVYQRLE